jgi:hypothetical protein
MIRITCGKSKFREWDFLILNAIFELLSVPCGKSQFCKWH